MVLLVAGIPMATSAEAIQVKYKAITDNEYCENTYTLIVCQHLKLARERMRGNFREFVQDAIKSDLKKNLKAEIIDYGMLSENNSRVHGNRTTYSMPMDLNAGVPEIIVNLGGKLFRVTLDTAATDSTLDLTVEQFKQLSFGSDHFFGSGSFTIGGSFNDVFGLLKSIEIGPLVVENAPAQIIFIKNGKYADFGSVIGLSVFNYFHRVSFDFHNKLISFNDNSKLAGCDTLYEEAGSAELGDLTVHPKINGVSVTALIDTGAEPSTMLSAKLASKLDLKPTSSRFIRTERGVSTVSDVGNVTVHAFGQQFILPAEASNDSLPFGVDAIFTAKTFQSGKLSLDFQNGSACFVREAPID